MSPAPALATRPRVPLDVLGERARPTTLAAERALPVLPALAPLLPGGALPRGWTVEVRGTGATSLALGLVVAASAAGSWTVAVGAGDLGLVAAAEAGLSLARTVLVAPPPPERWATVVATLAESVEIVLARPTARVSPADVRRLGAHLRHRGGVLVLLPGPDPVAWPVAPDLTLRTTRPTWSGAVTPDRLDGAGRLRSRRLAVEATGRRRAARPRRAELWLPGPDGLPAPVAARPGSAVPDGSAGAAPDRRGHAPGRSVPAAVSAPSDPAWPRAV